MNDAPWRATSGDRFLALIRAVIPWAELRHNSLMPTARVLSTLLPWEPPVGVARSCAFADGTSLSLRTPLMLAAGANKAARCLEYFAGYGFGAVTVGTATLRPRSGNSMRPRARTLEAEGAIQNAMGLNNPGVGTLVNRVNAARSACDEAGLKVGFSIAEDPDLLPGEDGQENLLACLECAYPAADYLEINLSCPNTGHARLDQAWENVERLLGRISNFRERQERRIPVWIKLSPDLGEEALQSAILTVMQCGLTGLALSNTWPAAAGAWPDGGVLPELPEVGRPGLRGGLSGRPLYARTLERITLAHRCAPALSCLASGGVETGAQVRGLIAAGADFVEIYSVLAFRWLAARKITEEFHAC